MRRFQFSVADHQRGPVQPRQLSKRPQVRREVHVPVAEIPVGKFVPWDGLHLHVHGEQVVAGMGPARYVS